jgi:hypothetical protein
VAIAFSDTQIWPITLNSESLAQSFLHDISKTKGRCGIGFPVTTHKEGKWSTKPCLVDQIHPNFEPLNQVLSKGKIFHSLLRFKALPLILLKVSTSK